MITDERQSARIDATREFAARSVAARRCLASLQAGAVGDAEAQCREALRASPEDPHLLHLLGLILARTARDEEALASFERAIALAPDNAETWNSRGTVLAALGRHREALASLDRALVSRAGYGEALVNRGDVFRVLGRAEEALSNYTRALAVRPEQAAIIAKCGMALAELGRHREALEHHSRAIRLAPDNAEAHHGLGVALAKVGRHQLALASFTRALSLRPDYVEAYISDAKVLAALGRRDEAIDSYDRALAIDPTRVDALHLRSQLLDEFDRPEVALAAYDRALAANPKLVQALIGKGNILARLERYDEALSCFDEALGISPELTDAQVWRADILDRLNRLSHAEAHCFRGATLLAIDRFTEAVEAYDQAIALSPHYAEAWIGRGHALTHLDEHAEAVEAYNRVIALRPGDPGGYAHRSTALRHLGRLDEATTDAERALALNPHDTAALNNLGYVRRSVGRLAEALDAFDRAVAFDPECAESRFNRAVCRLGAGDLGDGFAEYEWRWRLRGFEKGLKAPPFPLWLGEEDIAGRTVLLHAEQGYGDTIQFCRYVPLVAARGARVVLAVQPLLASLLAALPGVRQLVGPDDRAVEPDFRCPLMSLPLAFGTRLETIPATVPYLAPPETKLHLWQERLGEQRTPRIGIAWSGNARHKSDRDRSLLLEQLAPIAALGLPIYCLQRELRPRDFADFAMFPNIRYFADWLHDFADTAALIAQMDLVITVDTAVAHLAGAMAKPVWLMLPHVPDWRWLMVREDSPWYPTMRLFRQSCPGEWQPVVLRVREALENRLNG